jgi:hypothetical protein
MSAGYAAIGTSRRRVLEQPASATWALPDYYLVVSTAQPEGTGPDLYLGPLRAVRPRRVAVAGIADSPAEETLLLDSLRSLAHGPWWPPLDELLDAARNFYAGGLAETQNAAPLT